MMKIRILILAKVILASNFSNNFNALVSNSEYNLAPAEGRTTSDHCGFQLYDLVPGDKGWISTPNYPQGYPPNLKCIWWLKSVIEAKIVINCDDVHTQKCTKETAELYDYALFSLDWTWENYTIVCGKNDQENLPSNLESFENEISIFFRSSLKDSGRGMNCSYRVIEKELKPAKLYNGEENCGKSNLNDRIVGGIPASQNEFPWIVGLSLNDTWFCGGSLINQKWILTAAHCLTGASFANVLLGAHQLYQYDDNHLTLKSTKFYIHPQYNASRIKNDIGLIELPKVINFTKSISPVCLPMRRSADYDMAGEFMVAAGWGKTSTNGSISEVLNKLTVRVISEDECKNSFGNIIHKTTMCAVGVEKGSGTCQGDSGSSLQLSVEINRWVQVGLVSFGAATGCVNDHPNGYSKISYYLDWIGTMTGMNFD